MTHTTKVETEEVLVFISAENTQIPRYATPGASGADLVAKLSEPIKIPPGEVVCIPTGAFCEIPQGFEIQIRPRSGLAIKHCLTVLNTPGTIDSDYRGEIQVILINHGKKTFTVENQMKIAQMVLSRTEKAHFVYKEHLQETKRGHSGFGHTGVK